MLNIIVIDLQNQYCRYRKLAGAFTGDSKTKNFTKSPILQMEEEKKEHTVKMKKMEQEMEQVFEMKVYQLKQLNRCFLLVQYNQERMFCSEEFCPVACKW